MEPRNNSNLSNASTILNDQYHRSSSAAREIGLIKLESFSNRIGFFFHLKEFKFNFLFND